MDSELQSNARVCITVKLFLLIVLVGVLITTIVVECMDLVNGDVPVFVPVMVLITAVGVLVGTVVMFVFTLREAGYLPTSCLSE